jgi:hypothetical protein
MTNDRNHRYYTRLAAAFVRGSLGIRGDDDELFERGLDAGLKLHKFKRTSLPRVSKVLGVLRGVQPESLLDIGSGRGVFLWPLLDAFPSLPITSVEVMPRRAEDLTAVARGGVTNGPNVIQ